MIMSDLPKDMARLYSMPVGANPSPITANAAVADACIAINFDSGLVALLRSGNRRKTNTFTFLRGRPNTAVADSEWAQAFLIENTGCEYPGLKVSFARSQQQITA